MILLLLLVLSPGRSQVLNNTERRRAAFEQQTASWEHHVRQEITTDYNKEMPSMGPPPYKYGLPPISITYSMTKLLDVDERGETVTLAAYLRIAWTDTRLQWELGQGIKYLGAEEFLRFTLDDIWYPYLVHYNTVAQRTWILDKDQSAFASGTGSVYWTRNLVLTSPCAMDVTYFPVDSHICRFQFSIEPRGSRYLTGRVLPNSGVRDSEWHVGKAVTAEGWEAFHKAMEEGKEYSELEKLAKNISSKTVTFEHRFHRKYQHYLYSILAPVTVLSVLVISVFFIPPDAGEKISLGITLLLTFAVFQMTVDDDLPVSSDSTPLLTKAMFLLEVCSAMSIVASVSVLHIHHITSERGSRIPRWLKLIFFNFLAKITCHTVEVKRMEASSKQTGKKIYENVTEELVISEISEANHTTKDGEDRSLQVLLDIKSLLIDTNRAMKTLLSQPRDGHVVKDDADSSSEWKLLAQILDRVLMYVCLVSMSVVYITLFVQLQLQQRLDEEG